MSRHVPADYYEALERLEHNRIYVERRERLLEALGWPVPPRALYPDSQHKEMKVFSVDLRGNLPDEWVTTHPLEQIEGRQRRTVYQGYMVAPSAIGAARLLAKSEAGAKALTKNSGFGSKVVEVGPEALGYIKAVYAWGCEAVAVQVDHSWHQVFLTDLRKGW